VIIHPHSAIQADSPVSEVLHQQEFPVNIPARQEAGPGWSDKSFRRSQATACRNYLLKFPFYLLSILRLSHLIVFISFVRQLF
jgi:hypothetical protein